MAKSPKTGIIFSQNDTPLVISTEPPGTLPFLQFSIVYTESLPYIQGNINLEKLHQEDHKYSDMSSVTTMKGQHGLTVTMSNSMKRPTPDRVNNLNFLTSDPCLAGLLSTCKQLTGHVQTNRTTI